MCANLISFLDFVAHRIYLQLKRILTEDVYIEHFCIQSFLFLLFLDLLPSHHLHSKKLQHTQHHPYILYSGKCNDEEALEINSSYTTCMAILEMHK